MCTDVGGVDLYRRHDCLIKISHEKITIYKTLLHLIGARLFRKLNNVTSSLVTCANGRFVTASILKSRSSTVFGRFKALTHDIA